MSQQNFQSNSPLLKGCGCLLLLMCIGTIVAAALPSFLPRRKVKQSEPKQYVNSMNRGQQAYFAEKGAFTNSIPDLGLGIKTETTYYKYSIRTAEKAAFHYGVAKEKKLTSYVGGVFLVSAKEVDANAAKDEITTTYILCEADSPGTITPAEPTYQNGKVVCATGTTEVTK